MSLFGRRPKPIVGPWAAIEKPVLELGLLGKQGAIKEFVLLFSRDFPGQIVLHWQETRHRRKSSQQAFAVRETSGPQCPHCTALQLFTAIATAAAGANHQTMSAFVRAYDTILARESTPTYIVALENGVWELDCKAHRGDAHTKYDCVKHRR